jgi:hypothetical protein
VLAFARQEFGIRFEQRAVGIEKEYPEPFLDHV